MEKKRVKYYLIIKRTSTTESKILRVLLTRELVIFTVVSIPTEYKFTCTLRRSLGIFASSVFVATVRGILNTDV